MQRRSDRPRILRGRRSGRPARPRAAAVLRLVRDQFAYFGAEAAMSFRRNGLMTVAAVTTTMVALLVVGTALLLSVNLTHLAATLEAQVEIVAFLREGLTPAATAALQEDIAAIPGVAAVRFVGRREALDRLRQRLGEAQAFADLDSANPLPDSVEVNVAAPGRTAGIAASIERQPGVAEVTYGAQVTDRLLALTRGVRIVAVLLTLFLTGVALIVVVNTLRLTVLARRHEIEIMQLVGATGWFVQWPLVLEGVFQGAAAAAGAVLVLAGLYALGAGRLSAALPFFPVAPFLDAVRPAALGVVVAGILVGAAGSRIAARRFLSA